MFTEINVLNLRELSLRVSEWRLHCKTSGGLPAAGGNFLGFYAPNTVENNDF